MKDNYWYYRIKESRGFVSMRVIFLWSSLAALLYGSVLTQNQRILLPPDYLIQKFDE